MLKFKIPKIATLIFALLIVSKLSATTVTYTTSGKFLSTGNDTLTISGTQLKFTSNSDSFTLNPPVFNIASLGAFDLTPGVNTAVFTGQQFQLTVSQTDPIVGSATPLASILGTVSTNASNTGLIIAFAPATFTIASPTPPNATYSLNFGSGAYLIGGTAPNHVDVSAVVTARDAASLVPVPPASLAGMGLFAVMGIGKLRKRLANRA